MLDNVEKIKLKGTIELYVRAYREASGMDIKLHQNIETGDFIFMLKDERTLSRVCYFKADEAVAKMMSESLELFDEKMRGLIAEANVDCKHLEVEEDFDEEGNTFYYCKDCETEMVRTEVRNKVKFEVRTV
jgi:hypothetical protein